jgi:hypothetical protein
MKKDKGTNNYEKKIHRKTKEKFEDINVGNQNL